MKITKSYLKEIIKEELSRINEAGTLDPLPKAYIGGEPEGPMTGKIPSLEKIKDPETIKQLTKDVANRLNSLNFVKRDTVLSGYVNNMLERANSNDIESLRYVSRLVDPFIGRLQNAVDSGNAEAKNLQNDLLRLRDSM